MPLDAASSGGEDRSKNEKRKTLPGEDLLVTLQVIVEREISFISFLITCRVTYAGCSAVVYTKKAFRFTNPSVLSAPSGWQAMMVLRLVKRSCLVWHHLKHTAKGLRQHYWASPWARKQ